MKKNRRQERTIPCSIWLGYLKEMNADAGLLKKSFLASAMFHLALFFLVIPISCGKEQPPMEDKKEIKIYTMNNPEMSKKSLSSRNAKDKRQSPRPASYALEEEQGWDNNSFRNPYSADFNTEEYSTIKENPFLDAKGNPLSTFSIDVDTASYSNVRRFLQNNQMPPTDAVRIEEMINYFDYDYPQPEGEHPFSITAEIGECPWNSDHRLALIGLKGKEIADENRKPSNLVFLIDVSGSMQDENKLPLLKKAFKLLVVNLEPEDTVAIVVYASQEGLALPATSAKNKKKIINVIESLESGGCTAGAAGIQLAYKIASDNFLKDGNNRVILATDGDFNVGVASTSELAKMIEEKRQKGIYLTILGFGMGNYKDGRMEEIADKGNGNYYYIDNFMEGKKVLADEITSTLFTIAKDVKIQVEFNPAKVKAYRLIGYENRMLRKEDFKDDTKDAGELGAGHTVTALYEIVPMGISIKLPDIPDLKYQTTVINKNSAFSNEIMTVKLRYKPIGSEKSVEIVKPVIAKDFRFNKPSENLKFATAVAEFGMLLRNSEFKGDITYKQIEEYAKSAKGDDPYQYRSEFLKLVDMAKTLDERQK
jgi:Ca-activated chloride channel family protein